MKREIKYRQRYLREQNKLYSANLECLPKSVWPESVYNMNPMPEQVFRSRDFLVQQFPPKDGAIRLSVIRTMIDDDGEWMQGISWDELQRIKRACGYAQWCAIEIFPPDVDMVNVANMRHLWLIEKLPEFAWHSRQKELGAGA